MGLKQLPKNVKDTFVNVQQKTKTKIEDMQDAVADNLPNIIAHVMSIPGIYIDREKYLRNELSKYYSEEQVQKAIDTTPAQAGIPLKLADRIANSAVKVESTQTTAIAVAAGIPGGVAMAATIPADVMQYFGHLLRVLQKVAYIYGWPQFDVRAEGGNINDETLNLLILQIGVAFGVNAAHQAVQKIATAFSQKVAKSLVHKALTKGVIYPIVKKVATTIGIHMTKDIFAKGVSKAVPIVGRVVNGGLTLATFAPSCSRLKKNLRSTPLATTTSDTDNNMTADAAKDLLNFDDIAKDATADDIDSATEETVIDE